MSATARRSFLNNQSPEENARVFADPELSYRLLYWDVASVGATARDILAYGKAKWTNQLPTGNDWETGKLPTPFRLMPVLNVIASDGKEAFIAESVVVDHYLAKKFHLLGDNEWEEFTIKGIYNNIHYLRERSFMNVTWTYKEKRKEAWEKFKKETLPAFIADHEFHLKANGSNGHYIGTKLSLADIHLANVMDHFSHLPRGNELASEFQKSELLWKVKEMVEQNQEIAAWRNSEECKMLAQSSITCYAQTAAPEE
ncbi:Glutathione S-transferase S1 [Mortierella claussenii]|nr:Glutathione S-transferase S1 [Mortierella claussenii]